MPRIYTKQPLQERFWSKVDKSGECWLWLGNRNIQGYGYLTIDGKGVRAHRVAYELTNGPIPNGLLACHRCDNPACVRPDHIFLGTHKDNHADRNAKGRTASGDRSGSNTHPERIPRGDRNGARKHKERMPRGERHGNAKLTEAQVVAIRRRYAGGGITIVALASEYGVGKSTVGYIVNGTYWQHLDNPLT